MRITEAGCRGTFLPCLNLTHGNQLRDFTRSALSSGENSQKPRKPATSRVICPACAIGVKRSNQKQRGQLIQVAPVDGVSSEGTSKLIKKVWASAAIAASVVGASAAAAPQALAIGNDTGTTSASGVGASQAFGNSATYGSMSPQMALIQGSFNKPCIGLPAKANAGSLVGVVPVTVQDVPVLSAPQTQQCVENSTQAKGDEPLSHILDDISALSGNGGSNS